MATNFNSIMVALGMDTTSFNRGLAQASNQVTEFQGKLQKMLRAAGLRGAGRFLGIGAILYGAKEAFELATARAKELEDEQKKNVEQAYKFAEAAKGTPMFDEAYARAVNFKDALDDSTKAMLRFNEQAKDAKDNIADLFVKGIGAVATVGAGIGQLGRYALDRAGGVSQKDAAKALSDNLNYDQNQGLNDLVNPQQFDFAHKQADAENKVRAEAQKKAGDEAKKLRDYSEQKNIEALPLEKQLEFYQVKQSAASNSYLSVNGNSAADNEKRAQGYADELEAVKKIDEIKAKIAERDKQSDETLKKSYELDQADAASKAKQLSVSDELASNNEQLGRIQKFLSGGIVFDEQMINEAKTKRNELDARNVELLDEQRSLTDELAKLNKQRTEAQAKHNEAQLLELAPTEADIRSGKREGPEAQATLRAADEKARQAQNEYDQAIEDRREGDFSDAQRHLQKAKDLSAQADEMKSGLGTKESLEKSLTKADYLSGVRLITAKIDETNKRLAPSKPPKK